MTDLELNTDRSQVVSFQVEVNGSVSSSDFRLRVESGKGYDLSFPGKFDGKLVKFDLPKLGDSIGSGKRGFMLEMVADKEAFFSPLSGVFSLKKTLTIEAKTVESAPDQKISVKMTSQEPKAKPAVVVESAQADDYIEIDLEF